MGSSPPFYLNSFFDNREDMKCPFFNEVVTGDFNDMCIRYAGLRDLNQETINHFIFLRNLEANQM